MRVLESQPIRTFILCVFLCLSVCSFVRLLSTTSAAIVRFINLEKDMKEEDDSSNITCDAFWDSSIPHAFLNAANLFISYKSVSRVTAEREAGAKTRVGSVNSTFLQEGRVDDWTI